MEGVNAGGKPANGTGNNKNANAGAGGNPNNNKNLNNLNVNATANKETFAKAFEAAADYASGFGEISQKCGVLATTIRSNANIKLDSNFGNYGIGKTANQTIAAANLIKVKTFTESQNTPTRAAILVKILKEIKELVKKRRNSNRKAAANIRTAENFNKAIINLINAVNKAKGNAQTQENKEANNQLGNEKANNPPGNGPAAQQ